MVNSGIRASRRNNLVHHRMGLSSFSTSLYKQTTELIMNKEQIKGATKQVVGKVQEKIGNATGSGKQQFKGLKKQVEGSSERAIGNAKAAAKDLRKGY
jgi:uncharacterized protein YjbJ (UPF0337 family)